MPYRVELAKQGRATCKNQECKTAQVKIDKGEFRMGTLVTIHENTSWTWKHWGCITPVQIANLKEDCEDNTDMVDGYDELPEEYQEKIVYALEHGHVADKDWRGDVELNRPGEKGFRVKVKTPKKKTSRKGGDDVDEDADAEESKPLKKRSRAPKVKDDEEDAPASKKHGRAPEEEDNEEAPAPKKRGRTRKAVKDEEKTDESDAETAKPKMEKKTKAKKLIPVQDTGSNGVEPATAKPKKASKGRKATVKEKPEGETASVTDALKPKRGKKAAATNGEEQPAAQKRSRKKKAVAED